MNRIPNSRVLSEINASSQKYENEWNLHCYKDCQGKQQLQKHVQGWKLPGLRMTDAMLVLVAQE
jgi:hypothetical protein